MTSYRLTNWLVRRLIREWQTYSPVNLFTSQSVRTVYRLLKRNSTLDRLTRLFIVVVVRLQRFLSNGQFFPRKWKIVSDFIEWLAYWCCVRSTVRVFEFCIGCGLRSYLFYNSSLFVFMILKLYIFNKARELLCFLSNMMWRCLRRYPRKGRVNFLNEIDARSTPDSLRDYGIFWTLRREKRFQKSCSKTCSK